MRGVDLLGEALKLDRMRFLFFVAFEVLAED